MKRIIKGIKKLYDKTPAGEYSKRQMDRAVATPQGKINRQIIEREGRWNMFKKGIKKKFFNKGRTIRE